jgi:uncharacterized membrane protein YgdD (TMEM256/DUF423 family)
MSVEKNIAIAAFIGGVAVVFGALGAHALEKILDANTLKSFETAVRYQLFHALVLLFTALASKMYSSFPIIISKMLIIGILLFSGSIYLLVFLKYFNVNYPSLLGLITPVGGVFLIIAWMQLFYHFFKNK